MILIICLLLFLCCRLVVVLLDFCCSFLFVGGFLCLFCSCFVFVFVCVCVCLFVVFWGVCRGAFVLCVKKYKQTKT